MMGDDVMGFGLTFKRYEKKYLLSPDQYKIIKAAIDEHFNPDEYGETKICNLYYDTPEYLLTIRSNDKPVFKEKLRLRTYGVPNDDTTAFLELKRKYKSVVYKRRIHLPYAQAINYTCNGEKSFEESQKSREIDYFINTYTGIAPRFYISYDRSAFFYKESKEIRITFDKNITARSYDLDLRLGSYGEQLLPEGYTLMEIKVPSSAPLWLAQLMSDNNIQPTSFSKVGVAYKNMISREVNRKWNYSPVFSTK